MLSIIPIIAGLSNNGFGKGISKLAEDINFGMGDAIFTIVLFILFIVFMVWLANRNPFFDDDHSIS